MSEDPKNTHKNRRHKFSGTSSDIAKPRTSAFVKVPNGNSTFSNTSAPYQQRRIRRVTSSLPSSENCSNIKVRTIPHSLRSKIDLCSRQFHGGAAQGRQTEVARAERNALLQACQPPSAKRSPTAHQTVTSKKKIRERCNESEVFTPSYKSHVKVL